MNRRDLLRVTGLLGALAFMPATHARRTLLSDSTGGSQLGDCGAAIGVQLFTVRDMLGADPRGTLAMLGEIGFLEVELFGFGSEIFVADPLFGLSAAEFRGAMDNAGLTAPIIHVSSDIDDFSATAEIAATLGAKTLINPMGQEFLSMRDGQPVIAGVTGHDQINGLVSRLNAQGQAFAENGIAFGYHNHHMEFELLDDRPAFDYIAENTDPDLVKFELDLGWVTVAGHDPVEYLNRYHDRIISVHMKDFDPALPIGSDPRKYPIPEQAQLVEPGAGTMDFKAIVKTLNEHGICHRFVEIDVAPNPSQSVERGYQYLAGLDSTDAR